MNRSTPKTFFDRYSLGVFFTLVGAVSLIAIKFHHTRSLTNPNDPGPWLMPTLLGSLLLIGGIAFIVSHVARSRTLSRAEEPSSAAPINWQPWYLLGGVILYVLLLPAIGFLLATPAFVFVMLWRMGIVWWKALIAALVLTAVGQLVFVWGFRTPLPTASWNN